MVINVAPLVDGDGVVGGTGGLWRSVKGGKIELNILFGERVASPCRRRRQRR